MRSPLTTVKACLQAYVDKDRDAIEALIARDYHFTSPLDNALDRKTYFEICWPNSAQIQSFEFKAGMEDGESAFIVYEGRINGKRLRNCERHVVRDGQIHATEVYFGWGLPHKAAPGSHVDPSAQESQG